MAPVATLQFFRGLPLSICTDHPWECQSLHVFIEDRVRTLGHSLAAIRIRLSNDEKLMQLSLINRLACILRRDVIASSVMPSICPISYEPSFSASIATAVLSVISGGTWSFVQACPIV